MKNNIAIAVTAISLSFATSSTLAASDNYIPWTFDDFDSNGNVINITTQETEESALLPVIPENDQTAK